MAMNNTTADACATAMASAMGISDADTIAQMKVQMRALYTALKADIQITIATNAIVTTGSAATQTGPAAPININPN